MTIERNPVEMHLFEGMTPGKEMIVSTLGETLHEGIHVITATAVLYTSTDFTAIAGKIAAGPRIISNTHYR